MQPEPYPNLQFPEAQANQVITAARQALSAVKNAAGDRSGKVRTLKAGAEWTGTASHQFFGSDAPNMAKEASSLVTQLHQLIHTVQSGLDSFHQAQAANAKVNQANSKAFRDWLQGSSPTTSRL